tara:strand:+ start:2458 stop:2760 length:303 start_codon:yes stop_codon:yes gene_type:complete
VLFLINFRGGKMRGETQVTYLKNDKVKLVMSGDEYKNLLKGNNELKSAVQMMHECHTIYLEDLGKLETLEWRMQQNLGFMRRKDRPYGGYVLSNHPEADS